MAAILKKPREGEVLESVYSVIALLFILVACVDLCDAVAVVDVYRLIQYDLAGVPFGSRLASLNHHAGSSILTPAADLSRTVILIPVREMNNITLIREYIGQRRPLGGLIFLLPWMFSPENKDNMDGGDDFGKEMKNILVELEPLLIHANIPYPVYFAFEDDNINAVLADVKMNDATGQPATATAGGTGFDCVLQVEEKNEQRRTSEVEGKNKGKKGRGGSDSEQRRKEEEEETKKKELTSERRPKKEEEDPDDLTSEEKDPEDPDVDERSRFRVWTSYLVINFVDERPR
ncbi:hypothetical protein TEA_013950 [Camellia sinensis var. sinensis]|uniref:Uncharacterized protein n=1 Tax=Camellia sinensis var. sinensis TaxID=542762 RepID=A0A4S4DKJ9_CAMSN|nr:hypothetical protein TEA_013950 [Camellia sinensis var. sinensis]